MDKGNVDPGFRVSVLVLTCCFNFPLYAFLHTGCCNVIRSNDCCVHLVTAGFFSQFIPIFNKTYFQGTTVVIYTHTRTCNELMITNK